MEARRCRGTRAVSSLDQLVRPPGANVTLADGIDRMIPSDVKVQRSDLMPGATVKASFEERGGQKVVTAIPVELIK